MGIHDGHRERLRKRFLQCGFDGLDDHNVLEMMLIYAIPRRDTNGLAHELIDRFGSLAGVLEADPDELKSVNGIGESAVVLLRMFTLVNKRYLEEKNDYNRVLIGGVEDVVKYFKAKFAYETEEIAFAMFLDSKNGVINCKQISKGVVNATEISVRQLVEGALKCKASAVILAHNHPSGNIKPSFEDENSTRNIKSALELVGIKLIDHVVIGDEAYLSMSGMGWL